MELALPGEWLAGSSYFAGIRDLLTCVSLAAAQKEKKKKPDTSQSTDSSKMLVPMTDEQQIDYTLSEMLGAWQLGDVENCTRITRMTLWS